MDTFLTEPERKERKKENNYFGGRVHQNNNAFGFNSRDASDLIKLRRIVTFGLYVLPDMNLFLYSVYLFVNNYLGNWLFKYYTIDSNCISILVKISLMKKTESKRSRQNLLPMSILSNPLNALCTSETYCAAVQVISSRSLV